MKTTIDDLLTRRSIRSYKPVQITSEELNTILETGIYAPSGMGKQSAKKVVVQDAPTIKLLSSMNAAVLNAPDTDPFFGAPTVVVVLADRQVSTYIQDGSLVMGNLLLAAHALGLGGCWINRAREMFRTEKGQELLKKWGVEGDYEGIAICTLGYPGGPTRERRPRKEGYIAYA